MSFRSKAVSIALLVVLVTGLAAFVQAQQRGRQLTPEQIAERQRQQAEALAAEMAEPRPIDGIDSIWIEELTWMEVRDAIKSGKTTAIVATGGVEPNGPYLATGKHNYVLQGACEGIARELGNALCAPIVKLVPEGDHEPPSGHMRYPGTISLREETFEAVLEDVGTSLKVAGFENVVFIGDSGGNQRGMEAAAAALNERWADSGARAHFIPDYYTYDSVFEYMETELGIAEGESDGYHDDFVITSLMMITDPQAVRYEQRVAADKATINGLSIADLDATVATGRKLMQFRVDKTVAAIRASIGS
ncbi:MAG: creatininase family protein [Acidobacteriota bacterium]|jgi:creatinine amidohydrolase/Fe(II)-dependent formamide hydrolase-like protein